MSKEFEMIYTLASLRTAYKAARDLQDIAMRNGSWEAANNMKNIMEDLVKAREQFIESGLMNPEAELV